MEILITGIHGFVGSNLVADLKNHHTIYGLDIVSPQKGGVLKTYGWDALDQVPFVNTILHLAGKAHDNKNTSDPKAYFDINCGLTQRIFDYFLQSEAEKFIFFSSIKAVADTVGLGNLTEEVEPVPKTPYGKSKLEAERYILSQNHPVGKKVYILRPAMIHGPGNKGNLNLLYSIVSRGFPYPLAAYDNNRSFTSVGNLLYIIEKLIEVNIVPGTYNVCDDESLSTNEIVRLISQSVNQSARLIRTPKIIVNKIARLGDVLRLALNSERLKKLTESYVVSNAKLKRALSIQSLPVTARDGLIATLRSFQR